MSKPDDFDWGDNLVAPFNYYVRETLDASEEMDNFDLNSADELSCQQWRDLRKEYVDSALKLVDVILKNPAEIRQQLKALLRDH
jgi:hypothetical protein